ncbi:MAG TPA: CHAD domain-containing protein [Terriglobia bacterium]|nr:CHAD domain-containing protein [Terriglobia bacterium]
MHQTKETTNPSVTLVDSALPPVLEPEPHREKKAHVVPPGEEWSKVRKLAVHQLERFLSLEPKVLRGDDPDAIHDMRVATRRLQQALDLLYPPPAAGEIRKLRRVLQRSRRSLSEIRNCDVLLKNVGARLARKRTPRREIWTAVEHYLHQRRSKSFEKALRRISKTNMAVFYVHLKGHLTVNGAKPDPAHHPEHEAESQQLDTELFYQRISGALEDTAKSFEDQIALSLREPSASVIHGARIAAKRLRYLVEVVREFGVPGSDELLVWLRRLQRQLGEWHDLEVLEEMMIDMVARREFLRDRLEIAMGVQKLMVRNRVDKKALREKYFKMTEDSAGFRQMKEWVAYMLSAPSAAFAKA